MEEDIQEENENPEEKMATLATEEVEPSGKISKVHRGPLTSSGLT